MTPSWHSTPDLPNTFRCGGEGGAISVYKVLIFVPSPIKAPLWLSNTFDGVSQDFNTPVTVGLHISVRAGPTISSANVAIHYDSSDHEEPTRPALPTTTTTTTPASNVTGSTTAAAATTATTATTTPAPTTTTAAATAATGPNPATRLYTSSTGTDDDTPITDYEKVVVQQVSHSFV